MRTGTRTGPPGEPAVGDGVLAGLCRDVARSSARLVHEAWAGRAEGFDRGPITVTVTVGRAGEPVEVACFSGPRADDLRLEGGWLGLDVRVAVG